MSKIALTPNASGSGTFTIASPNSDTDRTLTLPDEAGTVLTSASTLRPNFIGFSASNTSAQTIAASTSTIMQLDETKYNVGGYYDTSTYKFTPLVAGYYQFAVQAHFNSTLGENTYLRTEIFMNGANTVRFRMEHFGSASDQSGLCIGVIYMNGTTDYVQPRVFHAASGNETMEGGLVDGYGQRTFFEGHLVGV